MSRAVGWVAARAPAVRQPAHWSQKTIAVADRLPQDRARWKRRSAATQGGGPLGRAPGVAASSQALRRSSVASDQVIPIKDLNSRVRIQCGGDGEEGNSTEYYNIDWTSSPSPAGHPFHLVQLDNHEAPRSLPGGVPATLLGWRPASGALLHTSQPAWHQQQAPNSSQPCCQGWFTGAFSRGAAGRCRRGRPPAGEPRAAAHAHRRVWRHQHRRGPGGARLCALNV